MPKKPTPPPEKEDSVLVSAAKVVGSAAGKVAALAGASESQPATKSSKVGKLLKKDKHRVPRKQKKAAQKAAASRKS
jgi:hypothetical protein